MWISCSCLSQTRRDSLGRSQRQRDERQCAVGASGGWKRGRAGHEEVLVVVSLAEAVAHARGRVAPHAAASGRVIQIVAGAGGKDLAVVRLREFFEDAGDVLSRGVLPRE